MDIFADENENISNGLVRLNNINKAALGEMSGAVVDKVMSGEEDALEVYVKAKAMSELSTDIMNGIKELAKEEAGRYEKDESVILGCNFSIRDGGTSYSFDHDETWSSLDKQIKKLNAEKKEREKQMIEATKFAEVVDKDTGEVIPPAKISSYGGSSLVISIPKK